LCEQDDEKKLDKAMVEIVRQEMVANQWSSRKGKQAQKYADYQDALTKFRKGEKPYRGFVAPDQENCLLQ